jgi:hypothetical protein
LESPGTSEDFRDCMERLPCKTIVQHLNYGGFNPCPPPRRDKPPAR